MPKQVSAWQLRQVKQRLSEVVTPDYRLYGTGDCLIATIHGGPGAPGEMTPVARELSQSYGVIEPLQKADSIAGQLDELHAVLQTHCDLPLTLIGYSWGAMLSYLFAAKYPALVKKLILVSSAVFDDSYAKSIMETRMSRLSKEEAEELISQHNLPRLEALTFKTDSYDPIPHEREAVEYQPEVYKSVWKEAQELRSSGRLLELGKTIECPVVAIHGTYDPHPYEGVQIPLQTVLKKFRMILLDKCGHHPWLERQAKDQFYASLRAELL